MIVYLHKIKYYHIWTIYIELVWLCKLGNILYLSKFKKYNSQSEMGFLNKIRTIVGSYTMYIESVKDTIISLITDFSSMKDCIL